MELIDQYKILAEYEQKLTQNRYTTFTTLVSISFVVAGFASNTGSQNIEFFGYCTNVSGLSFLLGFFFYLFGVFHYTWHHRYSHLCRKELKRIEYELGINVYNLRVRPKWLGMKFHFDWTLYILGFLYFFVASVTAGWILVSLALILALLVYGSLLLLSRTWNDEPLE